MAQWPIGKRYDGGCFTIEASHFQAYAAATDDPNPAYQGPEAVAPPMFHVRAFIGLMMKLAGDRELGIDRLRLVHGEHGMTFHRLLRHGDELELEGELTEVSEKSSGTVYCFALRGWVGGELACEGRTAYFVRSKTAPTGPKKAHAPAPEVPAPSWTRAQPVNEDQATRYAQASGDHNPIHVDPEVAKRAGLPGVVLHGLCTLAFAARDLVEGACARDPGRLASLSVRFAAPVFPGETLSLEVWEHGAVHTFATRNTEGKPVLAQGRAEVR